MHYTSTSTQARGITMLEGLERPWDGVQGRGVGPLTRAHPEIPLLTSGPENLPLSSINDVQNLQADGVRNDWLGVPSG